jgi:hypothetical protein
MGSAGMTRRRRVFKKEAAEKRDALRRKRRRASKEAKAAKEIECKKRLQRKWSINEKAVSSAMETGNFRNLPINILRLLRYCECKREWKKAERLVFEIIRKAPNLARSDYIPLASKLSKSLWIRPIEEWVPRGCSPKSIFISLVDHLLVRYPVPRFLYTSFFESNGWFSSPRCDHLFQAVANGCSPYRYLRDYEGIPLTRRMCHHFMATPADTPIVVGLRRAQVEVLRGDRQLADRICGTFLGRNIQKEEAFWQSVIHWFCNHWDGDKKKVGPLMDYIKSRRDEDWNFSMKGRSILALVRGMEEWHRDLARLHKLEKYVFKPSGFHEANFEMKRRVGVKEFEEEVWSVEEVLTSKDLVAEGKKMRHCVAGYADAIQEGISSIWSLKKDGERRLTIEINNARRNVVQVAGPSNKSANAKEREIVKRWARANKIDIWKYAWL